MTRTWWPFIAGLLTGAAAVCAAAELIYRKRRRDAQLRLVRQNVEAGKDVTPDEFDRMWDEASPVTIEGALTFAPDLSADRAGWL